MAPLLCSGCYLAESAAGQLELLSERRPIASVVRDPHTSPALRAELEEVSSIRDFATRDLKLPDNGSYRSYADVGRPYVVWNVVAAPEFSVQPKEWCYPIVGCVAYRGYFKERGARKLAARLQAEGLDVSVAGVAAYSTLGHFDDPILSTMMGWSDVELAAIVFHELTHQLLYVPGDASFNEALAVTVEEEGVRRWLLAQRRHADLTAHLEEQRRELEVIGLLRATRRELAALYSSGLDATAMAARKRQTFDRLRGGYGELSASWGPHPPFQAWFGGTLNNAQLASVATYYDCVPGFERELAAVHGDLTQFFARVRALAELKREARDAAVCVSADSR
jgi:predicted aminopeptidase